MIFSRLLYYASSIPTLLSHVRPLPTLLRAFLGLPLKRPFAIRLQKPTLRFQVRSAMDIWAIKESCVDEEYQMQEIDGQSIKTIIDIGAGLGDSAIWFASKNPGATVYAFEPLPESYALLQRNLHENQIKNVRTYPLAVFDCAEKRSLRWFTNEAVQFGIPPEKQDSAPAEISVEGTTLSDIFMRNNLSQCDILKIDCEGGEFEILLKASRETLSAIRCICIEYHDGYTEYSHTDLAEHLKKNGFEVRLRRSRAHDYLGFLFAWRKDITQKEAQH